MSTGSQQVSNKLDVLIDVNRKMLLALTKDKDKDQKGKEKKKGKVDEDEVKKLVGLAGVITEMVKAAKDAEAIKPAAAKKISDFYTVFMNGLKKSLEGITPKKMADFKDLIKVLSEGTGKFMKALALTAIIAPLAFIGAKVFALILTGLTKTFSKLESMKKETLDGIKSLMSMAKGIALFSLTMLGISLLAPRIAMGTLVFIGMIAALSIAIKLTEVIAGDGTGFDKGPVGSLLKMGKGIALFSLTMLAISFLAPQIAMGTLVFIVMIAALAVSLKLVEMIAGDGTGFDKGPVGSLLKMGKGIALFSLTMLAISFLAPQIAMGTLVFITIVAALAISFRIVQAIAGDGKGLNKGAVGALMQMGKAIALFSIILFLVGLVAPQVALGALVISLSVLALGFAMRQLAKPDVKVGSNNLRHISLSLLAFGGAMLVWGVVAMVLTFEAIAKLALSITVVGLAVYVLGNKKVSKEIKEGIPLLSAMALPLALFAGGMGILALATEKLSWKSILMMGAVITILGGAAYILGTLDKPPFFPVTVGTLLLIGLGAAFALFSAGFLMFATGAAKFNTKEKVMLLGGVILSLGLALAAIGLVSPFVILGATAMIAASAALIPISIGLSIFKAGGFAKKDSEALREGIHAIQLGFLGMDKLPSSPLGWFLAGPGILAMAGSLLIAAPAMILASIALVPIAIGLAIYKRAKFTTSDAKTLRFVLKSLGDAFADVAEGGRWKLTMKGIMGLLFAGGALVSIAAGIEAMANMTYTEYEYDEKTKKLIPKRKIPLTRDDVKRAGDNAAYVISVLAEPLAKFGAYISGKAKFEISPGKYMSSDFLSVTLGLNAMKGLGLSLGSLAEGVKDWANMTYTEYGLVYNPKTKMPELRALAKKPIGETEITKATTNISKVLQALIIPIAEWGMIMAGSGFAGGPLSMLGITKNPIEKGLDGIGTLGKSLSSLSAGVKDWAAMTYTEYGMVYNPTTKMKELKPIKRGKITQPQIKTAAYNIANVLSAMMIPIMEFGLIMAGGGFAGGPLSMLGITKNPIEKGLDGIGTLGKGIKSLAEGVKSFASMEFTEYEKNSKGVLVPSGKVKITRPMITRAVNNIALVLSAGASAVMKFSKKIGDFSKFSSVIRKIKQMNKAFADIYGNIKNNFKDKDTVTKAMSGFNAFFTGLFEQMNVEKLHQLFRFNKMFNTYIKNTHKLSKEYTGLNLAISKTLLTKYDKFTKITEKLANIATPFEKFVKAFGDMAKHMGVFSKNFANMSPDRINAYKEWTDSMVMISRVDISKSGGIIDFVNGVVNSVVDPQKPGGDGNRDGKPDGLKPVPGKGGGGGGGGGAGEGKGGGGEGKGGKQTIVAKVDTLALANAIKTALKEMTVTNLTVTGKFKNG